MSLITANGMLAVCTAVCTIVSIVVYIRSIRGKHCEPYIWAWVIRITLAGLAVIAQFSSGSTYSLALSGAQFVGGLAILWFIIARFRHQLRASFDMLDVLSLVLAISGTAIWVTRGEALFAIWGIIIADSAATFMGVKEAFRRNRTESMLFWNLSLLSATIAIASEAGAVWTAFLYAGFSVVNAAVNIWAIYAVRRFNKLRRFQPMIIQTELV